MTDRPIIFSGPMVRALLEGRKTMTRRIIKPKLYDGVNPNFTGLRAYRYGLTSMFYMECSEQASGPFDPKFHPGDRLYVRESFYKTPAGIAYVADGEDHFGAGGKLKKGPAIHLPKIHSRITLTVEAVKVERLQDISEEDAYNEGVEWNPRLDPAGPCKWRVYGKKHTGTDSARHSFETLWQSLNAKRAPWDSNPWVVAVTFKVHKCNIKDSGSVPEAQGRVE